MFSITSTRARRVAVTTIVGLAAVGSTASSAAARGVEVSIDIGPYVAIYDLAGVANNIKVTGASRSWTVTSLNGVALVAGASCTNSSTTVVKCTRASLSTPVAGIYASLAKGNDRLDLSAVAVKSSVYGDAGSDTLIGGSGDDLFIADNQTVADAGADVLTGNAGRDTMAGGFGNDKVSGGPGNDGVVGNSGNDTLSGGLNDDVISAGTGIDIVDGDNPGDLFSGGNDTIDVRDGENDTTECSGGTDTVTADPLFPVLNDWYVGFAGSCETVTR